MDIDIENINTFEKRNKVYTTQREDMEAELTEAPKNTSNTDNLEVAEEANVNESVN